MYLKKVKFIAAIFCPVVLMLLCLMLVCFVLGYLCYTFCFHGVFGLLTHIFFSQSLFCIICSSYDQLVFLILCLDCFCIYERAMYSLTK